MKFFICVFVTCILQVVLVYSKAQTGSKNILQRKHYTLDTCAKACLEEKSLKCKYFKFINTSGTCYLSSKEHPDFSSYGSIQGSAKTKQTPTSKYSPQMKKLLQKHNQIQNQMKQLKGMKGNLNRMRQLLKRKFAIKWKKMRNLSHKTWKQQVVLNAHTRALKILTRNIRKLERTFKWLQRYQKILNQRIVAAKSGHRNLNKGIRINRRLTYQLSRKHKAFQNQFRNVWKNFTKLVKSISRTKYQLNKRIRTVPQQMRRFLLALAVSRRRANHMNNQIRKVQWILHRMKKNAAFKNSVKQNVRKYLGSLQRSLKLLKLAVRQIASPLIAGSRRNTAVVGKLVRQFGYMNRFHRGMRRDVANTRKYMARLLQQLKSVIWKSARFQRQLNQQRAFTLSLMKDIKGGAVRKVGFANMKSASLFKKLTKVQGMATLLRKKVLRNQYLLKNFAWRMKRQEKTTWAVNRKLANLSNRSMRKLRRQINNLYSQLRKQKWLQRAATRGPKSPKALYSTQRNIAWQLKRMRNTVRKTNGRANYLYRKLRKAHVRGNASMRRLGKQFKNIQIQVRRLRKQSRIKKLRIRNRKQRKKSAWRKGRKWLHKTKRKKWVRGKRKYGGKSGRVGRRREGKQTKKQGKKVKGRKWWKRNKRRKWIRGRKRSGKGKRKGRISAWKRGNGKKSWKFRNRKWKVGRGRKRKQTKKYGQKVKGRKWWKRNKRRKWVRGRKRSGKGKRMGKKSAWRRGNGKKSWKFRNRKWKVGRGGKGKQTKKHGQKVKGRKWWKRNKRRKWVRGRKRSGKGKLKSKKSAWKRGSGKKSWKFRNKKWKVGTGRKGKQTKKHGQRVKGRKWWKQNKRRKWVRGRKRSGKGKRKSKKSAWKRGNGKKSWKFRNRKWKVARGKKGKQTKKHGQKVKGRKWWKRNKGRKWVRGRKGSGKAKRQSKISAWKRGNGKNGKKSWKFRNRKWKVGREKKGKQTKKRGQKVKGRKWWKRNKRRKWVRGRKRSGKGKRQSKKSAWKRGNGKNGKKSWKFRNRNWKVGRGRKGKQTKKHGQRVKGRKWLWKRKKGRKWVRGRKRSGKGKRQGKKSAWKRGNGKNGKKSWKLQNRKWTVGRGRKGKQTKKHGQRVKGRKWWKQNKRKKWVRGRKRSGKGKGKSKKSAWKRGNGKNGKKSWKVRNRRWKVARGRKGKQTKRHGQKVKGRKMWKGNKGRKWLRGRKRSGKGKHKSKKSAWKRGNGKKSWKFTNRKKKVGRGWKGKQAKKHGKNIRAFRSKSKISSRTKRRAETSEQPFQKRGVAKCPPNYTASTVGHYCFLASTMNMSAFSTKDYCNHYQGAQVAIETKDKQKAVQKFLYRNHYDSEMVWLSPITTSEGLKVWKSNHKPLSAYNNFQGDQPPYENSCVLFQVRSGKWINQPCSHYQPLGPSQVYRTICEPNQAVYSPNRQIIPGHETYNIQEVKKENGSHSSHSSGGSWNGFSWLNGDSKQSVDLLKSFLNSRYK